MITRKSRLPRSISSPDGTFRVECEYEPHERTAAWEMLRIITNDDNKPILRLPRYFFSQLVEFPEPGVADIQMEGRFGQRHRLRVNVNRRTFILDTQEAELPLDMLSEQLFKVDPKRLLTYRPLKTSGMKWIQLGIAILSLVLAAGAICLYFFGTIAKIRMFGLMSAVYFGIIAAIAITFLALRLRRRRW